MAVQANSIPPCIETTASSDKMQHKKRYEYPFGIDNNKNNNSGLQLPSLESHDDTAAETDIKPEILSLRIPKKEKEKEQPQSHKNRVSKRRKRPNFKQSPNCNITSSLSGANIPLIPLIPAKLSQPLQPSKPSKPNHNEQEMECSSSVTATTSSSTSETDDEDDEDDESMTPNVISYDNAKCTTTATKSRHKWNEIEDIWLKWNFDHIRHKKNEIYFTNVNDLQWLHLPTRFPWNITHKLFNGYYEYNHCFTTFDDANGINMINKEIAQYLNFRSEDSIKQHWRNPLWKQHDNESRKMYCEEYNHNMDITNEEWNNVNETTKWLYRRAVIYKELLFTFINTKYYKGKSLGIRIINLNNNNHAHHKHNVWLVTYSDLKILRFDSHLKAAKAWDYEVRSNHGTVIDSNLPFSVKQYLDLTHEIYQIWNTPNIKQKWSKLKVVLTKEYMDKEYGIYPTLQSLLDKLVMIYEWKNKQIVAYHEQKKKNEPCALWKVIDAKQLHDFFNMDGATDIDIETNIEFEHFVICMLELMVKTAEISCYGFTDHFIVPQLNADSLLNTNKLMLDDLKYCLFDVQFDLNHIITRMFKYYALNPFYKETVFEAPVTKRHNHNNHYIVPNNNSAIDIDMKDIHCEFGPDNAMTLHDCKTLTDSLLNIPFISAAFSDLSLISQKLEQNKYQDVASYLEDLKRIWDHAMTQYKVDHVTYKLAKKYKALCLKKFELFFEGLTSDRRRSKRLINQNGLYSIRNREEEEEEEEEEGGDDEDEEDGEEGDDDGDNDPVPHSFICPRCNTFQGKNSRSLKTHMRYCNKGAVMQYLEQHNGSKHSATKCECGFTSHVAKGLQSHQLTCELIKRRLNNQSIPLIAEQSKIRMWISTQWYTGTVIKHTPTADIPNLYQIHFRSKGDEPLPYNLEKFNFRLLDKVSSTKRVKNKKNIDKKKKRNRKRQRKRKRNENAFFSDNSSMISEQDSLSFKRRKLNNDNCNECNPYFIYLHDMSTFRHNLFVKQYDAFQSYVDQWLNQTKLFISNS